MIKTIRIPDLYWEDGKLKMRLVKVPNVEIDDEVLEIEETEEE